MSGREIDYRVAKHQFGESLRTQLAAKDREIAALRSALEPFAKHAELLNSEFADHGDDIIAAGIKDHQITFGDFRRALAALSGSPAPDLIARILEADAKPPEATFTNADDMMAYLDAPDPAEAMRAKREDDFDGPIMATLVRNNNVLRDALIEVRKNVPRGSSASLIIDAALSGSPAPDRDPTNPFAPMELPGWPDPAEDMRAKCEAIVAAEINAVNNQNAVLIPLCRVERAIASLKGNGEG